MDKRLEVFNSRGQKLVGILHLPENESKSIIIISHGSCSTKDRERLIELANALTQSGFVAFRFDFSGCGESYESEITVNNQVEDLKAIISFFKGEGYERVGLHGESLGGLTSILAFSEKVNSMVLWAPVSKGKDKFKDFLEEGDYRKEELDSKGFIKQIKHDKEYRLPREYFEERLRINQDEILSRINIPTLILHGDADDTVPLESSKEALNYLPEGSKLEIISDGSHTLKNHLEKVVPLTVGWFEDHLNL